jgi:phage repressor protein C with HTH and peptisase S24 domain
MSEFHERLLQAMRAAGYKDNSDFARAVGVSPQSVFQWVKGDTQPGRKNLLKVTSLLRVNLEWLLNGAGPRDSSGNSVAHDTADILNAEPTIVAFDSKLTREIPLVELEDLFVSDGRLRYRSSTARQPVVSMFPTGPRSVAFTVQDRSMEPRVERGDMVVIDPDTKPLPGDYIAIRLVEKNQNIFRKYSLGVNGEVIISPENALYETLKFSAAEWGEKVEILGVMTWLGKPRRT